MLNSDFYVLKNWMFGKLNDLLVDVNPNSKLSVIKMSIGEPQLKAPMYINDELMKFSSDWSKYPPSIAIPRLKNSIMMYLQRRFNESDKLVNPDINILPVPGTREPLHLIGLIAKNKNKSNPIALVTNPYYHAWRTGGIECSSKIYWLNAKRENNYNPDLDEIPKNILDSTVIMYLCFPSNPQGGLTSLAYLKKAINLAKDYDFVLALDECYIDIYRLKEKKPIGGLDAIIEMGADLKNIIIFNSLSKRSNVPGIRSGFIVADEEIINIYKLLVSNGAAPVPIPIQNVASALYDDDAHNVLSCKSYDYNFELAKKYLGKNFSDLDIPKAGFFLWLPVHDDIKITKSLWKDFSIRVMPGSFMAEEIDGYNPGKNFLRIALVYDKFIIEEAMKRITECLSKN